MSSTRELWKQFEELELKTTEKIHICDAIKRNSNDDEEKESANFEIYALEFENSIHHYLDPVSRSISYEGKTINEMIRRFRDQYDEKKIKYYEERYRKTPNIFDKWWYAFCYWILTKDPSHQNNALDCLFSCIERCLQQKKYEDGESLLVIAFNISRYYNLLSDDKRKEKDRVIQQALELINAVQGTEDFYRMRRMVEVLSSIDNGISSQKAQELILLLHHEENTNYAKGKPRRNYRFFEASLDLCNKLQEPERNEQKQKILRMLGESFEKDGDSLKKQADHYIFLAYDRYEQANEWYLKLNDRSKINDIAKKIDSLNLTDRMDVDAVTSEVPSKQLKDNTDYESVHDIIRAARSSIPSVDDITEEVTKELEENPLSQAAHNVTLGRKNPVSVDDDKESIIDSEVIRRLRLHIETKELYLANVALQLYNDEKISTRDFIDVLSGYGLDHNVLELIKQGINRYFAKDYISSIHILIPQVEATLRYLQDKKGIRTVKVKGKYNIMDLELGNLLREEHTRRLLGENLARYLEVKFTDQKGMNLRNEVSHGLLKHEEFDHARSFFTLVAILLLA